MNVRLALAASTLALLAASPSMAMSKGAAYLMKERIAAVCPGGGTFAPKGITERDLTGDGRADLILDLAGLTCRGGANGLNDESGAAHCPVAFYVRKGDMLPFVFEVASIGARVGPRQPAAHHARRLRVPGAFGALERAGFPIGRHAAGPLPVLPDGTPAPARRPTVRGAQAAS